MNKRERVQRSAEEEKWAIVQEAIKSGNISETCRRIWDRFDAVLSLEG